MGFIGKSKAFLVENGKWKVENFIISLKVSVKTKKAIQPDWSSQFKLDCFVD